MLCQVTRRKKDVAKKQKFFVVCCYAKIGEFFVVTCTLSFNYGILLLVLVTSE